MSFRSPLYPTHIQIGAKLIDFSGWEMPIHFSSPIHEHKMVRTTCGLFDISHMGRIFLTSRDTSDFLLSVTTVDSVGLKEGHGAYGFIVNTKGGIVDDIYLFRLSSQGFLLVVNAVNRERVVEKISKEIITQGVQVKIEDVTFTVGMLALQGPAALEIWDSYAEKKYPLLGNFSEKNRNALAYTRTSEGFFMVSRTGYTGENGIEIIAPNRRLPSIWKDLTTQGVCPSGLAARDSLRFEAGFPLYGHEISESVKPVDVGLSWAIRKSELSLLSGGLPAQSINERKLIWFTMLEKAVPRQGYIVYKDESGPVIGEIASGMFAPSLNGFYGNCLIPFESRMDYLSGSKLYVEIHGKKRVAEVVKAPLYTPEYRRKRSDT